MSNCSLQAKGLAPLPDPVAGSSNDSSIKGAEKNSKHESQPQGLSFASKDGIKPKSGKRKAVGDALDDAIEDKKSPKKKKAKKPEKKLLSFEEDA